MATPCQPCRGVGSAPPLERPGDEGVGPAPVEVADIRQLGAFHEGPHLVDGTDLVGREMHDHTPMTAASPT